MKKSLSFRDYERMAEPFKATPAPEAFSANVGFIYVREHSFICPSNTAFILYANGTGNWSHPDVAVIHMLHPDGKVSTGVYYGMAAIGVLMSNLQLSWRFKPTQITHAIASVQKAYATVLASLGESKAFGEEKDGHA